MYRSFIALSIFQMFFHVNIKYGPKEIEVKNSENIYTDDEFQVKLPKGFKLKLMPNMYWILVYIFPIKNTAQTYFFKKITSIFLSFLAPIRFLILQTPLGP
jgi:hypothetical protein